MNKKAQGAMEYLLTYGWAIIVVVIVGIVLWQLGIFSPNEYCLSMWITDAMAIAGDSECVSEGTLQEEYICNEDTMTVWIDLKPDEEKPLCNPACVVDIGAEQAEINWRCSGVLP